MFHPPSRIWKNVPFAALSTVLLLSAVCFAGEQTGSVRARALEALNAGRPAEAVKILESSLSADPGAVDLLELLGTAHLRAEQHEKAEEVWSRLLRAFPRRHRVRLWLAQLLEKKGRRADARTHYEVLTLPATGVPDTISALARLGMARTLLEDGDPSGAIRILGPFLSELERNERDERKPEARLARSLELRALSVMGRVPEALGKFQAQAAAHGAEPEWAPALLAAIEYLDRPRDAVEVWCGAVPSTPAAGRPVLARILWKAAGESLDEGDPLRACAYLRQALDNDPDHEAMRRDLGWAELEAGLPDRALAAWRPLLESGSTDLTVLRGAKRALLALHQPSRALEMLRSALARAPHSADIRWLHWSCLEETGRTAELLRSVSGAEPSSITDELRAALAAMADRNRADEVFRDMLGHLRRAFPDDDRFRVVEAKARRDDAREARRDDDLPEAIRLYRLATRLDPSAAGAHRDLAFALRAAGDLDSAIGSFREACRLEPGNDEGRAFLIRALREAGRLEEARRQLAEAPAARDGWHPSLRLEACRLAYAEGRLDEAEREARLLVETESSGETRAEALGIRADALTELGKIPEALAALEDQCREEPWKPGRFIRLYRTALHTGRREWAIRFLEGLLERFPVRPEPYAALIEDARAREQADLARDLLREYLDLVPGDLRRWNELGDVELERSDFTAAFEAFRSALAIDPLDTKANLGIAIVETRRERHREALERYEFVLSGSPFHYGAHFSKLHLLEAMGDLDNALEEWRRAREILPTEYNLYLQQARLQFLKGHVDEAAAQIRELLDWAREGTLPILLYHGISPHFESGNLPAALFRDQMRALREAGYTAVGLREVERWLRGEDRLPRRAILITFDDARSNNLTVASSILEEFGHKAVEFVITGSVREHRGYYLSWKDMEEMAASGVWEFGSHSHQAHQEIQRDTLGTRSRFLVTRRWMPEENRLETIEEMEERLALDALRSKTALKEKLGLEQASAVAFPYGSFGQRELTNEPQAYLLNRRIFEQNFLLGFHQSGGTYNLRRREGPPALLTRFSVPEHWDGETLVRHLRENDVPPRAQLYLARILSWSGYYGEALEELARAEALGASEAEVLSTRAHALLWRGDRPASAATFQRLLALDPTNPGAFEQLDKLERYQRPSVSGRVEAWEDSDDRLIVREFARGSFNAASWLRLHAEGGYATYSEDGREDVEAFIAEAGALASLEGPLELEGALGHSWFDQASDTFHYVGALRWKGWDLGAFGAEAIGGPVETPRAVLEGIRLDAQSAYSSFDLSERDRVRLSYRHTVYSDGNLRHTVRTEYGHRLLKTPTLRLGVEGAFDSAEDDVPEYYAPQDLAVGRLFLEVDASLWGRFWATSRVSGGYGLEEDDDRFVGSVSVGLRWTPLDWLEFSGSFRHSRNPDYWGNWGDLRIAIRF